MLNGIIKSVQEKLMPETVRVKEVKQEIILLDAEIASLKQQNTHAVRPFQFLSNSLGFGNNKKIEWAQFKLKLKQKELDPM